MIHLAKRVAGTMYIYFITTTSRASKRFLDPLPVYSLTTVKLDDCGMKQMTLHEGGGGGILAQRGGLSCKI